MCVLRQSLIYFGFMVAASSSRGLPTVDPGLFVISGVGTCGDGNGYCLLGTDCTLDEDFTPDDQNGHCDGLKSAFTPSAHFVCCKDTNRTSSKPVVTLPRPVSTTPDQNENEIDHVIAKLEQSVISFKEAHLKNSSEEAGLVKKEEEKVSDFRPDTTTPVDVTEVTTGESEVENVTNSTDPSLMLDDSEGSTETELMSSKEIGSKDEEGNGTESPEMNDVGGQIFLDTIPPTDVENESSVDQGQEKTEVGIQSDSDNSTEENQFDMIDTMNSSDSDSTGDNVHQRPDKSKDPEPEQEDPTPETTQPSPTDLTTLTSNGEEQCGMSARCIALVRFDHQNTPLCYGNPLFDDWIITSASCALRIFRLGMFNVSITPETIGFKETGGWYPDGSIKTIIVHENYRALENQLHLDTDNIGLLKIYRGLGWNLCRACLPKQMQKFQGEQCNSYPLPQDSSQRQTVLRFRYHEYRSSAICEGKPEALTGTGDFLSIPCLSSSWAPRSIGSSTNGVGLPLRCDGILAGIQAAEGIGTRVYTSISSYIDWIEENTMQQTTLPMQTFRRF